WCGLFFSLGHGVVVTLVGVAVALVATEWQAPHWLENTGAWISIGVLLALGIANLLAVLRAAPGVPVRLVGLRGHWLSERLAGADARAATASRCMSVAIALLCLGLAAFSLAKYPAGLAPVLSAGSVAVVFLAYLAARRTRGPGAVLR